MDRAPDYGSGGWGFKSLRAHHKTRPYEMPASWHLRLASRGDQVKTFQVRQSIHYDLMLAAGTEQEAILKAGGIPLTQWETESTEITAELVDETEELDEY